MTIYLNLANCKYDLNMETKTHNTIMRMDLFNMHCMFDVIRELVFSKEQNEAQIIRMFFVSNFSQATSYGLKDENLP